MTTSTHSTYPATTAGILAALAALGDTSHAVANTLAEGGYTGKRGLAGGCPIAHYLNDVIPDADPDDTAVSEDEVTLYAARCVSAPMPPGPAAFVVAFDHGAYDDLGPEL